MNTIHEVEQYAAQHGIILTPADRAKITAVQQSEAENQKTLNPVEMTRSSWADKFNEAYPRLLDAMLGIGDVVIAFAKTAILSAGIPVALVGLLVVEHHRIVQGIRLFEIDQHAAGIASLVLVIVNLVFEFQSHHIEHTAGWKADEYTRWSLRIMWGDVRYWLGIGDRWEVKRISPASRYLKLLKLVTFTILTLALLGSMQDVIKQEKGTWHESIISIVTDSTLLEVGTWLGGLLFALAAVLSAQGLSRYVAIRTVEIVASMRERAATQKTNVNPHTVEIERAGAMTALALVNEKLSKKQEKNRETVPFGHSLPIPVGNGHTPMNGNGNGHGGTNTALNGHEN